jgi:PAS domain S-box-containing protein
MDYKLHELIDVPKFQDLLDSLNDAFACANAIIDNDSNVLTASGWQDICTKFHRVNPDVEKLCKQSDLYILGQVNEEGHSVIYACPMGLTDCATPIIIGGRHVGNAFIGQFFSEKPDMEYFRDQAKRYGFDEEMYLEAVSRVPVLTGEQLERNLTFIRKFAEILAETGLLRLKELEISKDLLKHKEHLEELVADRTTELSAAVANLQTEIIEHRAAEENLRNEVERGNLLLQELKLASAYNRSLIEASLDPLVTIGPDGRITDVNVATETATGLKKSELIGTDFSDYFSEPDRARAGYQQVYRVGIVRDFALELRHRDGHLTPVLYNASVYKGPAGEVAGVFAAARDVSERKRAEEALRCSENSLKEAQRIANIGNWELDLLHNSLTWSDEIFRIFEVAPEEFGASYDAFINIIHPDDREGVNHAYTESLINRTPYDIVHRLLMNDGRIKWVHEFCETHYDDSGGPLRSFGTVQDITEREKAEDEIRKLNAELEQRVIERTSQLEAANKELESFSYSVSHDLRAPLRSIDGFSQALLEDSQDKLDEQGQDYLRRVRNASQRMAELIDDMLKLSRVTRDEMKQGTVDLSALARTVAEELRGTEPDRRVEFIIQDTVTAKGDPKLLRLVIENLLGNSWKFTSRQEQARIEFGVSVNDGRSEYFVRDDGAGFDMAYADKLFVPFQRLHDSREFSGTGIGLSIVQRIIRRHGGEVWAKGAPEQGATFYFTLQ